MPVPIKNRLLRDLVDDTNDVNYVRNDTIFKEGSPVRHIFFLRKGLIKIVKVGNKEDFIVSLVTPNSFFGLSSSFASEKYMVSAYALDQCIVNFIEIEKFRKIIRNDGRFAEDFIKMGVEIEMEIISRIIALNGKQLPGKLADALLCFSTRIFNNDLFTWPLNRQEMSNYLGVSLKSLNKTLKDFDRDGLIEMQKSEIKIIRKDILEKLSKTG